MNRLRLLISVAVMMLGCWAAAAQSRMGTDSSITITGRVQAEGKPLANALVTLWDQGGGVDPNDGLTVASGRTDAEGNYELKNVPTGNYFIAVRAAGFVTGKENDFLAKLRFVTVVGGQNVGPFNFDLVREGVIEGTVTDAAGKPLARIPITLKAEATPDGSGPPKYAENIKTDDQGHYRIANMPAGKYRIAAGHFPLVNGTFRGAAAYRRVFYPDVVDEAAAKVVDIKVGSEVTGINFDLGQPVGTFTIRARIVDDRTGKPVAGLSYRLGAYLNGKPIGGRGFGESRSNESGEAVLSDIPPGEYSISVPGTGAFYRKDGPQTPNHNGESAHFEVTDKDLNVEVRVTRAASVAGFVVVEGPASQEVLARVPEMILSGVVETNPMTPTGMVRATIRPDGSFLFTDLRAGKLKLNFGGTLGKPLPLMFVRTERDGVKVDGLDIQLGDELNGVKLVMAYANSGLHGFLKLDDGSIPRGLIGMASLQQGNQRLPFASAVNQNGEFVVQNLVAGEYELSVAAHDAIGRQWQVKQKIKIEDDKVAEARLSLDSKVRPNPAASSKSYLQP